MKQVLIEGIQSPIEEVSSKISQYFIGRGFKKQGDGDCVGVSDGDFDFKIEGTIDELQVQVFYQNYKPRKSVIRDIMALDDRISTVSAYRSLSSDKYEEELTRIEIEPIFVMIDGKLMQTTIYEYVNYVARNIDYSRR